MKNRILIYVIRLIELVFQIEVFSIGAILFVMGFFGKHDESLLYCCIVMAAPVTLLYIVRMRISNNIVTILAHVAAFVFVVVMGRQAQEKLGFVIMGVALIIYSGAICINENRNIGESMPIGMICIYILGIILGRYIGLDSIYNISMYMGMSFIVLQVIHKNLDNLNDLMVMNNDVGNFPARQMVSVNTFIMTIVLVLCAGAMFISNNTYVYKMLGAIGNLIVIILRVFFKLFYHDNNEVTEITPPAQVDNIPAGMGELPPVETGLWTEILNGLFIVMGSAVVVALAITAAFALVRFLRTMKGRDGIEGEVREFIAPEDTFSFVFRKKKEEEEIQDAANVKIRKLYKTLAKKGASRRGRTVASNMVPEDISGEYIAENARQATEIYERARYSNLEITKEDVDYLKKLRKNMPKSVS